MSTHDIYANDIHNFEFDPSITNERKEERKLRLTVAFSVRCFVLQFNSYCRNEILNAKHSNRYRLMTYSFLPFLASSGIFCFILFSRQVITNWSVLSSNGTFAAQQIYWIDKIPFCDQKVRTRRKSNWIHTLLECVKCLKFTHFFIYLFLFTLSFTSVAWLNAKLLTR